MIEREGFDYTYFKKTKIREAELSKIQKMTWFQTYIALIKGYCGACVLFTPKAFANGGLVFSPLALILSGFFTTICAIRLIRLGMHYKCYSYSEIVQKAFG